MENERELSDIIRSGIEEGHVEVSIDGRKLSCAEIEALSPNEMGKHEIVICGSRSLVRYRVDGEGILLEYEFRGEWRNPLGTTLGCTATVAMKRGEKPSYLDMLAEMALTYSRLHRTGGF